MKQKGKISLLVLVLIITTCKAQTALEYYKLGVLNDSIELYAKALKYYSLAIKKNPKNPNYYVKRANVRYKISFIQKTPKKEMFNDLNKAISLETWNYSAVYWKAFWLYKFIPELHDVDKAISYLDSLVIRYPERVEAYRLLGEIGLGQRDTIIANKNYKKLLELTSNKSEIYTEMADFEFIYGFYQQAINHYSLASNLTNYRYNNLAISYWKLGKKDDACIYFREFKEELRVTGEYQALVDYCKSKK